MRRRIQAGVRDRIQAWKKRRTVSFEGHQRAGSSWTGDATGDEQRLIERFLAGGRIPWSPGYGEYRLQFIARLLADESGLRVFRDGGPLPRDHGYRIDERAVEYPWTFSRAETWGPRILDAGATLNYRPLLSHPALTSRRIILYDLAHEQVHRRSGVSYVNGDLRQTCVRDGVIDVVVCISTLEHIGLDNTAVYARADRYREHHPASYKVVLREFRRVLAPGGRALITVPFGRATSLTWLQQFDLEGVRGIIREFEGTLLDVSYFRYDPEGWIRATAESCAHCEYFDVHTQSGFGPDYAAAARAVACIELVKSG